MSEAVEYAVADGVATLTLNSPGKLNAFDAAALLALRDALDRAESDDSVRVVVLTGAGRFFSSGQDIAAFEQEGLDLARTLEEDYAPLILRLIGFSKVTIAALNGPAVGAGANLALACDIVVAARSSYMQQVFVRIGLIPDVGGTWLLPRIVGAQRALALALTGDRVSAQEAHAMGLVYRVFDDAAFAADLRAFAGGLASGPLTTYRLIKDAFRKSGGQDLETQLRLEARLQGEAGRTPDFREAVNAFKARRPPVLGGGGDP
jgi:2-(1,2-epoxy-1,2-dihydrophenyl)acetyl-CoA isomerase